MSILTGLYNRTLNKKKKSAEISNSNIHAILSRQACSVSFQQKLDSKLECLDHSPALGNFKSWLDLT